MSETNEQSEMTSIIITPTPEFLQHVGNIAVEWIKKGEALCQQISKLQESISEHGPLTFLNGDTIAYQDQQLIMEALDEKHSSQLARIQRLRDALTTKKEEENN